jgi:hypothetical protein
VFAVLRAEIALAERTGNEILCRVKRRVVRLSEFRVIVLVRM